MCKIHVVRAALAASLLATGLCSQTTVSGGGAALQNAITAAAVGDTLLVQAGDYDSVLIQKGLTILCDPGVRVLSSSVTPVSMNQIPAGQTGRWHGGELVQNGVVASFRVFFCDGIVEVEGMSCAGCIINDSPQSSFTDCSLAGRNQVDNSTATFSNCVLHRTQFCSGSVCSSLEVVDGGFAMVTDSTITGPPGLVFFPASPGIYVDNGTIQLSGINTIVSPGAATIPAVNFGPLGGTIESDPLVTINGTVANGTVTTTTVTSSATTGGTSGATLNVDTYSEPGSFAFAFVGLPLPRVATPFGDLWMTPPVVTVSAGVVPASGVLAGSFVVPAGAAGEALTFQPASILTNGNIVLGVPTVAVYR